MTPQHFIAKWQKANLSERAACQEHFLDLCALIDHPTPAQDDPHGTRFTFEAGAAKLDGKQGWADVWKRGFFAWEYKGKHANLDKAYQQLLQYRESLQNPPLLVVCDIERIVESVLSAWGRVDILVNCAGTAGPRAPLEESDWAQWREALDLNLFGPAYLCRCIIPHMKRTGRGKIINISGGGATKAIRNLSSYGASKTGLVRLTETLALELAENAIDVNAVAPGLLATKMAEDVMEIGADILGAGYSKEIERQRRGEHDAFAKATALCVFLASSESDGITGRLLSAPWDPWASLPQRREELSGSDIYTLRRIVPEDRGRKWDAGS